MFVKRIYNKLLNIYVLLGCWQKAIVSVSKVVKGSYEQGKNVVKKEKGMKKKSKKGRSVNNARKHKISRKGCSNGSSLKEIYIT